MISLETGDSIKYLEARHQHANSNYRVDRIIIKNYDSIYTQKTANYAGFQTVVFVINSGLHVAVICNNADEFIKSTIRDLKINKLLSDEISDN